MAYLLGLSPPSWRIIARSSRIAQRSVIRPSARRYANITSRVRRPGVRSKPRNEPPGQSSSREPNWTTKSFSAAVSDHSHRAGWLSRRALCKNSRVPSMPCGRPGARASLTMSGAHSSSRRLRLPPPLPSSSNSRMTSLLRSASMAIVCITVKRAVQKPGVEVLGAGGMGAWRKSLESDCCAGRRLTA
jgi:hypothetical protein